MAAAAHGKRLAKVWRSAFEVPPSQDWPNVVQTLRYIRDRVIPTVGAVEPVSVYRNPMLNQCAAGAPESAHRFMQAVDLVPLRPITRDALIQRLCAVHALSGESYGVGLGFYVGLRFHIDSRKFRTWGINDEGTIACARSFEIAHAKDPEVNVPDPGTASAPASQSSQPQPATANGQPRNLDTHEAFPRQSTGLAAGRPCVADLQHHIGPGKEG